MNNYRKFVYRKNIWTALSYKKNFEIKINKKYIVMDISYNRRVMMCDCKDSKMAKLLRWCIAF